VASYYAGLAWLGSGQADQARAALERVVREWPDSEWEAEARRALETLDAPPAWWAELEGGLEWDDNVVLRGQGVQLPGEIAGQRDLRAVWWLDVGGEWLRRGPWALGGRLGYAGSAHRDLARFDVHAPALSVWADRSLGDATVARLELAFAPAWVDRAPFLVSLRGRASLLRDLGDGGLGILFAGVFRDDFRFDDEDVPDGVGPAGSSCPDPSALLCGPPGIDESSARNRDGTGWELGLEHDLAIPALHGELTTALHTRGFSARGVEYSYREYGVRARWRTTLPWSVVLELDGAWAWRPYRHPTTFPDPGGLVAGRQYGLRGSDRREEELRTVVGLERPLGEHVRVSTRWSYTRNRSTADVFDYRRHVIGAYLTVALGGG
jgi:hypothetical protein